MGFTPICFVLTFFPLPRLNSNIRHVSEIAIKCGFQGQSSVEGLNACSHHVGALLGPGEGERGVARPLAVQSDVRVHVYRDWPGLHYQYWADWKTDTFWWNIDLGKTKWMFSVTSCLFSNIFIPVYFIQCIYRLLTTESIRLCWIELDWTERTDYTQTIYCKFILHNTRTRCSSKTNAAWLFKQTQTNIATRTHTYHWSPTQLRSVCTLLTVHVHQDADVGASHSVENLTGHGLGEEGVICCGDKHTLSGPFQQNPTFCPPDRETHFTGVQALKITVRSVCQRENSHGFLSFYNFGEDPNVRPPILDN